MTSDGCIPAEDPKTCEEVASKNELGTEVTKKEEDSTPGGRDASEQEEGAKDSDKKEELPRDVRIEMAESCKVEGNESLKLGDFETAIAKYEEGIELTKDYGKLDDQDDGVLQSKATALHLALRLNSAQACLKQGRNEDAADHASKALLIDKDNTKALYRRAQASLQFSSESRLEQAKNDLARFAQLEPSNREAREQLAKVKEQLRTLKQLEKERYAIAMSGGGLYKEQHDKHARQQMMYEEEVARRKEAGEDEISFADWQKKEKEKEEEEQRKRKEAREKKEEEEARARDQNECDEENARRRAQGLEELSLEDWKAQRKMPRKKEDVVRSDDIEMDEEDKKVLAEAKEKGYYHGRLGTVPSDAAPKPQQLDRVEDDSTMGVEGGHSEWNQAGTWEEKDSTAWALAELRKRLSSVTYTSSLRGEDSTSASGSISDVKKLNGDAHIVSVRKKRKHGFQFDGELAFQMTLSAATAGDAEQKYKGTVSMPELADCVEPKEWRIDVAWKGKKPPASCDDFARGLREEIRRAIVGFVDEYKTR